MQKLCWVGNPFFSPHMQALGWDVIFHKPKVEEVLGKEDILALCQGPPDALIVADMSRPPFVLDVEGMPWPTVFYAVDTHIHSWFPLYAAAFDACMVSLKDDIPAFERVMPCRAEEQRVWWFPPYAPEAEEYAAAEPEWDCLFLGTVDAQKTPDRVLFLETMAKEVPLEVKQGRFMELFPKARVLLNFCEHGDLNFRVFEAMGAGRALVSPLVGHGLAELFIQGEDFAPYVLGDSPKKSASHAAKEVRALLEKTAVCQRMAQNGLAKVNAAHRAHHRAESLNGYLRVLTGCSKYPMPQAVLASLRFLYLHLAESLPESPMAAQYLVAAQRAKKA